MKRAWVLLSLPVVACLGCGGPDATVQGTVTVGGEIAHQGTVQFHPVHGGPTAYGTIANNGSYSLRVGQGDRHDPNDSQVQSGEYIVTAVINMPSVKDEALGEAGPPMPGARLSAEKYGSQETSDLHVTVKTGANVVPLELERAVATPTETTPTETTPAEPPAAEAAAPGGDATPDQTTPSENQDSAAPGAEEATK
jgi:hypothetical protein